MMVVQEGNKIIIYPYVRESLDIDKSILKEVEENIKILIFP